MSKRLTDTNKFKKGFHRSLPGPYKLLWDYLYHECDHAGIWHVDFEVAQIYIGKDMPIEHNRALELFNHGEERVRVIDNGSKWFITSFIEFQQHCPIQDLNPNNKCHLSIIRILEKHGLISKPIGSPKQGSSKALPRAYGNGIGNSKSKGKEGVQGEKKKGEPFVLPAWVPIAQWQAFEEMRKKVRKPMTDKARELVVSELDKLRALNYSPGDVLLQSVRKSWQDVYPIKDKSPEKRVSLDAAGQPLKIL